MDFLQGKPLPRLVSPAPPPAANCCFGLPRIEMISFADILGPGSLSRHAHRHGTRFSSTNAARIGCAIISSTIHELLVELIGSADLGGHQGI